MDRFVLSFYSSSLLRLKWLSPNMRTDQTTSGTTVHLVGLNGSNPMILPIAFIERQSRRHLRTESKILPKLAFNSVIRPIIPMVKRMNGTDPTLALRLNADGVISYCGSIVGVAAQAQHNQGLL
jgi:hypothetical protein